MNAPLNILYVIPRPEIGGAERQLLLLLQNLDRERYRTHVVCLDGGGSLLPAYQDAAYRVHVLNRTKMFDLKILSELIHIIRSTRPALVHTWLYIANLYGGWAARLAGVPNVIVSQRGLGIDPVHGPIKRLSLRVFNCLIAQFADHLITNARAVAEPMWNVGFDPAQTRIVYNGLDLDQHISDTQKETLKSELNIQPDQLLLGAIARIDPKKDLATMLRALAKVAQKHPGIRLLLIGGGFPEYQANLERLATDLNIQDRVSFLGFRSDPLAVLSLCKISLLSSVTEGLPNAVLESMFLGKPVVATRVGGVPELIQDGIEGYLVPAENHEAFANRILHLLDNPDLIAQMGAAGKTRALKHFSVQTMVRNTKKVYDELLAETDILKKNEKWAAERIPNSAASNTIRLRESSEIHPVSAA
ncbi:MAG: glycosyltransferase [bacterium]|nr:glycosyltransferase [bacterium]